MARARGRPGATSTRVWPEALPATATVGHPPAGRGNRSRPEAKKPAVRREPKAALAGPGPTAKAPDAGISHYAKFDPDRRRWKSAIIADLTPTAFRGRGHASREKLLTISNLTPTDAYKREAAPKNRGTPGPGRGKAQRPQARRTR